MTLKWYIRKHIRKVQKELKEEVAQTLTSSQGYQSLRFIYNCKQYGGLNKYYDPIASQQVFRNVRRL